MRIVDPQKHHGPRGTRRRYPTEIRWFDDGINIDPLIGRITPGER